MEEEITKVLEQKVKLLVVYVWELIILQVIWIWVIVKRIWQFFVPQQPKSLKGEIVLITGAGNGIGRAIAMELKNHGAVVVCWDIETKANSGTVCELLHSGTKAYGYTVDLSNLEDIKQAAEKVRSEVGDVSIVVNNAGIIPNGLFLDMNGNLEDKMLRVNVLSHFEIIRQFLPEMLKRNRGHIVTTASIASFFPAKQLAVYTACKHANYGFIESIKQEIQDSEYETSNIHFTNIYPCFVRTRIMENVTIKPKFSWNFPIVSPEYVAKVTVEGIRINSEHIFIPRRAALLPFLKAIVPMEVKKRMQDSVFKLEIIREPENNNIY